MFYAVNLVGAIANMIHPLSAEKEIEFYLNGSEPGTDRELQGRIHPVIERRCSPRLRLLSFFDMRSSVGRKVTQPVSSAKTAPLDRIPLLWNNPS